LILYKPNIMNKKNTTSVNIYKKGLTLIETLVALSIIVTVIAASSLAIQSTFQNRRFAASQLTAMYLLNDGVEVLRQIRDSDAIDASKENEADNNPLAVLPDVGEVFSTMNIDTPSPVNKISICSGSDGIDSKYCKIATYDDDGQIVYSAAQPETELLPIGSFRSYHEVLATSSSTKKRIRSTVEWSNASQPVQIQVITELANVTPPSTNPITPAS